MNDLRQKIDEAKRRLPLPELMSRLGLRERAKKTAHCPFHEDKHKSFSVFNGEDGFWHWKCFAGCGDGDEIMFLRKWKQLPQTRAMNLFLDMAGFPPCVPPKSHEYPESPESPVSPVYPVSNGQGLEKELKGLAARNACTERSTARKRRWQLARDVRAVEAKLSRELDTTELMQGLIDKLSAIGACGRASRCQGRADVPLPASRLSSTRIRCIGLSPMFSAAWVKGSR